MPREARADLLGGDDVILSGILAQAIAQVSDPAATLTNIEAQVQMMHTMLSTLDPQSFLAVLDLINDVTYSYGNVVSGIASVGYTIKSVNTAFQSTFPSNLTGDPSRASGLDGRWQNEILASSQVAERAQSSSPTWQHNASEAAADPLPVAERPGRSRSAPIGRADARRPAQREQ